MNATASRHVSVLSRAAALVAAALAVASCQAIAGIEERTFSGKSGPQSALCDEYCETVMEACPEDEERNLHFSVYPSKDACLKACPYFEAGNADEEEPTGNTIACRLHAARLASSSREYRDYCPQAGPGGGGVCGDDCESYCSLFEQLCSNPPINCAEKCKVFQNDGSFDAIRDHDGDTLQCRLVHVTNAALQDTHCGHAAFIPNQYCVANEVTCEHYCDVVMTTCSEDLKVYDDKDQCLAVCPLLDKGEPSDTTQDTVGCRTYHAYNSYVTNQPASHCPHAGPAGDGHCGQSNCPAYCKIAAAACDVQFKAEFGDEATCLEECDKLPDSGLDSNKVLKSAVEGGDGTMCRIVQAGRALEDSTLCGSVFGKSAPCN